MTNLLAVKGRSGSIRHGAGNARIEALDNKIKLIDRTAYGFQNVGAMIDLIMPLCSRVQVPWPGREPQMPAKSGAA